jgi:hypothetical protein
VFRFTSSSHPRSGLMACLSFSVVSMSAYNNYHNHPVTYIAWTRGIALLVGVVTTVLVNWVVWPFVARHELRKSLSSLLLNLGISYRGVVARYVISIWLNFCGPNKAWFTGDFWNKGTDGLLELDTSTTTPTTPRPKKTLSSLKLQKRN